MNAGHLRDVVHGLRRAADQSATADAELLRRYAAGDEAAFELLVWRHAAMVLGVCRRVLHHAQDAEDAFQATWLALARRARSVGRRGSVAGWLYQVAYRVALRARARAARRAGHEQPIAGPTIDAAAGDPAAQAGWRDLRQVLDEQIGRLPERFRAAFVLRCLAGLSGPEAARELGCAVGTVESRLARARHHLRAALVRRGFTVPAALVVAGWSFDAVAARAPAALIAAAVRGATALTTRQAAASTEAAVLAEGVLRTMLLTRLRKITTVAAIVLALAGAGIGRYGADVGAQAGDPAPQAPPDKVTVRLQKLREMTELDGEWLLEKAELGGKVNPDIGWLKNELRWVIRADSVTIQRFGQSTAGTISVDNKKSPKEIDVHLVEGPVPGERGCRGIYKRDGVRLTVCYAPPGEPRPTEFATRAGVSMMLAVFRWTDGRAPLQGSRESTNPPSSVFVPQRTSSAGPQPSLQLSSPYTMPSSVQLSSPYTMPPSLQLPNPYTVPFVLPPLQGPPFELPKDVVPPKSRPDGSKDA